MAEEVAEAPHGETVASAETQAMTEAHGDGGHGAEHPTALGLDSYGWVALAMLVVFGIMIWKKVPQMIGSALDKRIAEIRGELDEAAKLREEAEALKAEYEAKTASAGDEAKAILARAEEEAAEILEQAGKDADALIERRGKLAEDKIAAAERAAVAEVRAKAAQAATAAAAALIEAKHDAGADKGLVDKTISGLDARLN